MNGRSITANEATAQCGNPSHHGWEVIEWFGTDPMEDVQVLAICRDEQTAWTLANALMAEQAEAMGDQPLPLGELS